MVVSFLPAAGRAKETTEARSCIPRTSIQPEKGCTRSGVPAALFQNEEVTVVVSLAHVRTQARDIFLFSSGDQPLECKKKKAGTTQDMFHPVLLRP